MYIEMAWGGAEEQRKECEGGNPNAKDWHDDATQVIEKTMEEYWEEMKPSTTAKVASSSLNNHSSK